MIDHTLSSRIVGRLAGLLLVTSGLLSIVALPLPQPPGINRTAVLILALTAVGAGIVARFLPWHRWKRSASLWLLPVAFLLIAAGNYYGSTEPYTFGIFFVVAFAWIGIGHPRWTSLWFVPPATIAYVVPILLRPEAIAAGASSAALTIPVCILVAESLAWIAERERRTKERADALARVATTLAAHLNEEAIFQTLVDEVRTVLRSEHASLYRLDPREQRLSEVFTSGVDEPFKSALRGLVGTTFAAFPFLGNLQETTRPIAVHDATTDTQFPAELVHPLRVRSFLLMPVIVEGKLVGILGCAESSRHRRYRADEIQLFHALGRQAGVAINNAMLYSQTLIAARVDPLTEMDNRRAFHERMDTELERARRYGRELSLVVVDPDDFKQVNDSWGHQAGDRALTRLAGILRRGLRAGDGAYRLGGDEFALLLPETDAAGASAMAERVRRRIERARLGAGPEFRLTASLGVASFPEHGASTDELFGRADSALYEVKASGGNAVAVAPREHGPSVRFGIDLHAVIREQQVRCVFQPIVDLRRRSVLGYESFCRLDVDVGGPPIATLFRAASALGLSASLEALCRRTALATARDLPEGALLFLNMSPSVLETPSFDVPALADELWRFGLDPTRVVIEVTEQERAPASPFLADNLRACRETGLRIALDDLGDGSADLDLLARIPFDFVKLDMELVQGEEESRRRLFQGLKHLVEETGAVPIAEGVETARDLDFVLSQDIPAAQGFAFGPPHPRFDAPVIPDQKVTGSP